MRSVGCYDEIDEGKMPALLPAFDPDKTAFLLDFDGTLVEIAPRPSEIVFDPDTRSALARLQIALGGAIAIISGRSIADIEKYVGRDFPCIAGIHGCQRRTADGARKDVAIDAEALARIGEYLAEQIAPYEGLELENKDASIALHYRARPDLSDLCQEMAAQIADKFPISGIVEGKMIFEIKMASKTKADAVVEFMAEPPFLKRIPIYVGDDRTDEDAFRAVNSLGGVSILVGNRETAAQYRVGSVSDFLRWLKNVSMDLKPGRQRM